MKIKTKLLAVFFTVLLTLPSQANLNLSVSFGPLLNSSSVDTYGFVGSTWTLDFSISQTHYSDAFGFSSFLSDSSSLTVTGAGSAAYNGTFEIIGSSANSGFLKNVGGNDYFGTSATYGGMVFSFGSPAIEVSGLLLQGNSISSPSIGDPILASDWQGLAVSQSAFIVDGESFEAPESIVSATVIPEPSSFIFVLGSLVIAVGIVKISTKQR